MTDLLYNERDNINHRRWLFEKWTASTLLVGWAVFLTMGIAYLISLVLREPQNLYWIPFLVLFTFWITFVFWIGLFQYLSRTFLRVYTDRLELSRTVREFIARKQPIVYPNDVKVIIIAQLGENVEIPDMSLFPAQKAQTMDFSWNQSAMDGIDTDERRERTIDLSLDRFFFLEQYSVEESA